MLTEIDRVLTRNARCGSRGREVAYRCRARKSRSRSRRACLARDASHCAPAAPTSSCWSRTARDCFRDELKRRGRAHLFAAGASSPRCGESRAPADRSGAQSVMMTAIWCHDRDRRCANSICDFGRGERTKRAGDSISSTRRRCLRPIRPRPWTASRDVSRSTKRISRQSPPRPSAIRACSRSSGRARCIGSK